MRKFREQYYFWIKFLLISINFFQLARHLALRPYVSKFEN